MGLQWERMAEAVREQERNLRGLVRLQYPQQEDYPSLPADLYGEQDAREAQQRAEIVLDWVRGMLPGKVQSCCFFIVVWSRLFKCSRLLEPVVDFYYAVDLFIFSILQLTFSFAVNFLVCSRRSMQ